MTTQGKVVPLAHEQRPVPMGLADEVKFYKARTVELQGKLAEASRGESAEVVRLKNEVAGLTALVTRLKDGRDTEIARQVAEAIEKAHAAEMERDKVRGVELGKLRAWRRKVQEFVNKA
jgi:hypothetical protein